MAITRLNVSDDLDRRWRIAPSGAQWGVDSFHPPAGIWEPSATRPTAADCLAYVEAQQPGCPPATVEGRPLVRVVVDVLAAPGTDADTLAQVGEVLAERMGDNLDAVLGVNELLGAHDVTRWWVRYEPTPPRASQD